MKFPTYEEMVEMAQNVAEKMLDEYEYKGKTLRQWIEIISTFEHGANLAEVGTDCISRQAAIEALYHVDEYNGRSVEAIRNLPPAQPEPSRVAKDISRIVENGQDMRVIGQERIKGHWVDDCTYMGIQCSVCGKSLQDYIHATEYAELMEVPNFCPNCGADMREVTT